MSPFIGSPVKAYTVALALTACAFMPGVSTHAAPAGGNLADMKTGGAELYREIIPSILQVFTGSSGGSGYFIDKGGYAITNRHVAGGTNEFGSYEITLYGGQDTKTRYKATCVGRDPALDFALIKVECPQDKIVPIKLADTDKMQSGDQVATCGSPGGTAGNTNVYDTRDGWLDYFNFNLGLLTEIVPMDRCLIVFGDIYQHEQYADIYQLDYGTAVQYLFHVDAAINHGNSGGPCVNARGEAIGTNTWKFQGELMGYTVPVNLLARSAREILQYGRVRRPWLGISLLNPHATMQQQSEVDRNLSKVANAAFDPEPAELKITEINKYAPASQYLRVGDVIVSVDGKHYKNVFDVYKYILNKQVGDKVTLQVIRGGIGLPPITIQLAEKKNRFSFTHITVQGSGGGVGAYGSEGVGGGVVGVTY